MNCVRHSGTICVIVIVLTAVLLTVANRAVAYDYPEPDPPRVELGPPKATIIPMPSKALPTTEWTFHKSADGAHPDGNEQQFMWLMNRARAYPTQEGIWLATMDDPDVVFARTYFGVDLDVLRSEFAALSPKPPAAFDIRLYNAAKDHSDYLISIDDQNHTDQFDRIATAGFHYLAARGNVYSYSKTAIYGHAGFNIDWGGNDGTGMQDGRGHRMAIMSVDGDYTNVGIAAVAETDSSTNVGPLVVTGNYCNANTGYEDHYNLFIVGTVWKDNDEDGQYDPGEGLGNITVTPSQGTYYAVTSLSGGYAIPMTFTGFCELYFSGTGVAAGTVRTVSVGSDSVVVDLEVTTEPEPVTRNTSLSSWLWLLLGD